jgi:hypothetical protein
MDNFMVHGKIERRKRRIIITRIAIAKQGGYYKILWES